MVPVSFLAARPSGQEQAMEHSAGDLTQQTQAADLLVTLFCAIVVAVHAWDRYNTPESNRVSTTRTLFLFTGAGYVSGSLTLFLLLSEVVLNPGLLTFGVASDVLKSGVLIVTHVREFQEILRAYCAPPVLAAVILTVLLPHTPIVSTADRWLLERFQTWGRIPQGVRNLTQELTPQALHLAPADVAELQEWIAVEGEVPEDLAGIVSAEAPETVRGSLARVLRLYVELQKLEMVSAYRSAFRSQEDAWLAIKQDFRVFLAESQAFFVLFEKLTPLEGTAGETALTKNKRCYRDICRKIHKDMTEFLAQLLLMVEGSDQRIGNRLQTIGFAAPAQPSPHMQVGPFMFMGAMMILGMLGVVSVLSPQHAHVLPRPVSAVLIGTTRTIGILAAILPKMHWSKFRPDSRGNPPHLAWLGWAGVAAIISLMIERAAYAIALGDAVAALDFVAYPVTPMAPMAFSTSLVLSILCDVDLHLGHGWARRVSEGLLSAVAAAVSIYICTHLLFLTASSARVWLWMPYIISSGLGFVSGFFAPYLYRRARDEEPAGELAPSHAV
jgi:hypothetical protein